MRTIQLFEFYVRCVWPLHRRWVRGEIARRCRECVLSEKAVNLDGTGLCGLCAAYGGKGRTVESRNPGPQKALEDILRNAQGRGSKDYDALVLFSGGKDSTYLIRTIRDHFPGLRLLAVSIDNSFMSPIAVENIDRLIPRLSVAHLWVRPGRDFYVKLFRYGLMHLNADGAYGTVDFSDGEFLLDQARILAAEKSIPLILVGYSRYQVQNGLQLEDFESPRAKELADRTAVAGMPLSAIFSPEEVQKWWHPSRYPSQQVARLLFPLYAWDLEESNIKSQLEAWGLMDKHSHSPILTNHQLIPLFGVVDVHQRGYSSFEPEFCRMIREGKAEKRQWQWTFEFLEYTAKTGLFIKPMILDSLAQLNLKPEDVGIRFSNAFSTDT